MSELVWTLKPILNGSINESAYDWIDVGNRERAIQLHDSGAAFCVGRINQLIDELDGLAPGSERRKLIVHFLCCYQFGLPTQYREEYGTGGLAELVEWCDSQNTDLFVGGEPPTPDYIYEGEPMHRIKMNRQHLVGSTVVQVGETIDVDDHTAKRLVQGGIAEFWNIAPLIEKLKAEVIEEQQAKPVKEEQTTRRRRAE